ncbi:HAD-IC family P-type ATPase [Nibrella saemangeumensis]|uniref:HAD-IC family P-type ATPase n=1 Tax=Nibrella saemangeumensis TaxID=1084526 RepID=A0ABP8MBU7_9BACT
MQVENVSVTGLNSEEVTYWRTVAGRNRQVTTTNRGLLSTIAGIVTEPMFLLLVGAIGLYALLGDWFNAGVLLVALMAVAGISLYQERRSDKALQALRDLSAPTVTVIRDGAQQTLPAEDVVLNDLMVISEGERIVADGNLVTAHDLSVDESLLTGESIAVDKTPGNTVYSGTSVTGGWGYVKVTAVGPETQMGQLGLSLAEITSTPTPLQKQVSRFVRTMALIGVLVCLVAIGVHYQRTGSLLGGLLQGLTVAMSVLPEEIPVAFASFMALGAWRMSRQRILVKQPQTVEALGSATVICLDKTGTITQNRMEVAQVYAVNNPAPRSLQDTLNEAEKRVLEYAMWSSETEPTDSLEQAIHKAYTTYHPNDQRTLATQIHEYPLGGQPPMMTHVFDLQPSGERIIAAKGAPERILSLQNLPAGQQAQWALAVDQLTNAGYRVLGVAQGSWPKDAPFPAEQQDFQWQLLGLVALNDPPKPHISAVFQDFYQAGIGVKMVTGDNPQTAREIARQTGLTNETPVLTGQEIINLSDAELREQVKKTSIFARMFPEAKLRIINALKATGETVAMTGDGINDGPALKAAHIGVAMGTRGTEIARQAASLVLLDDDLQVMVKAIATGRTIHENIRKAIQYIISIHIPLIAIVLLPSLLHWSEATLFLPVHVIFFELIMGPTCSIAYESEPAEPHIMQQRLRQSDTLFSWRELVLSCLQGAVVTVGLLGLYWQSQKAGTDETVTRTTLFLTLLLSNIGLTYTNRSARSIFRQRHRYNPVLTGMVLLSLALSALIWWVPAIQNIFALSAPDMTQLMWAAAVAGLSVLIIEFVKLVSGSTLTKVMG